jgi:hypothetical protein
MLHAWRNTNMDARRSISLLIFVAGLALAALGMAASPVLPALGTIGPAAIGPVFGAAMGGYLRHRVSDHEHAPLWALAYGASVAVILVATFGMAAVIRPTVRGIPGLGDAWSGIIVLGFLVAFVGAFLWEREAQQRRFAALALLGVWLIVGGVFASMSGDPWGSLAAPAFLAGFGLILVALVVGRPAKDQDLVTPGT